MNTTVIQPGMSVYSGGGRLIHIAKTASLTVCGKPVTKAYSEEGRSDCYVCQRRSDRRR